VGIVVRCKILIVGLSALALLGCNRTGGPMRQLAEVRADRDGSPQFSFTNFWSFEMRRDAIAPRFERTRTACLSFKPLNCKLVSSNINTAGSEGSYPPSEASLEVLLPHSQIDDFKKSILVPITNESAGEVTVRSSSTRAENVGDDSANADRKVLRLTAYRDRLIALSKRPNLNIEDTIRLEAEISRVQGELDEAVKNKSDIDGRIARETVNISFAASPQGAIAAVFSRATDTFVQSVASALEFLIGAIPWLPIVAAAIALITWLVRLLWRRKRLA
jgi:hypothetical protein